MRFPGSTTTRIKITARPMKDHVLCNRPSDSAFGVLILLSWSETQHRNSHRGCSALVVAVTYRGFTFRSAAVPVLQYTVAMLGDHSPEKSQLGSNPAQVIDLEPTLLCCSLELSGGTFRFCIPSPEHSPRFFGSGRKT